MASEKSEAPDEDSEKWVLERIRIDHMTNVEIEEDNKKSGEASLRQRKMNPNPNPGPPRMGRMESGAKRGLMGLKFLDRAKTGKEEDAWRAIEKRFQQNAVDGRITKDKFGACIGIYFPLKKILFSCVCVCGFEGVCVVERDGR